MIKVNGIEVEINKFPDGTFRINCDTDNMFYADIDWRFESNDEMIILMFLTRHLRENRVKDIYLSIPYIPNARQDRVKDCEEVFTLKYFAEFINNLNLNRIYVFDPHSSVSEALINNLTVLNPHREIQHAIDSMPPKPFIAFYPDEGAMKRYSKLIKGLPYTFGIKNRDWKTGEIKSLDVCGSTDMIKDKNILIIDDICSKGGTFYHSAKKLKELGANDIYLYVSHCEKSIFNGEIFRSGLIKKVYTTDSIFTEKVQDYAKSIGLADKIEVINICKE